MFIESLIYLGTEEQATVSLGAVVSSEGKDEYEQDIARMEDESGPSYAFVVFETKLEHEEGERGEEKGE